MYESVVQIHYLGSKKRPCSVRREVVWAQLNVNGSSATILRAHEGSESSGVTHSLEVISRKRIVEMNSRRWRDSSVSILVLTAIFLTVSISLGALETYHRAAPAGMTNTSSGGSALTMTGAIYFKTRTLDWSGGSSGGGDGTMLVVNKAGDDRRQHEHNDDHSGPVPVPTNAPFLVE